MKCLGCCLHSWWRTGLHLGPKWRPTSLAALCPNWSEREEVCIFIDIHTYIFIKSTQSQTGLTIKIYRQYSVVSNCFPPERVLSAAPVSTGRRIQGQKISWWEGQKGLAFLQDVQLVDGELVVPQPGLYYVYAQTYFRHTHSLEEEGEDGEEVEDRGRPLLQYVYKKVRMGISALWLQWLHQQSRRETDRKHKGDVVVMWRVF